MSMRRPNLIPVLVAASLLPAGCATRSLRNQLPAPRAAGTPPLEAGQRVRVAAFRWTWTSEVGSLTALTADSIALMVEERRAAIPLDAVRKVEVSRGRRGARPGAGLVKGALIGAAVGLASALTCTGGLGCGAALILAPPMFAGFGGVIGFVCGALSHPEIWEPVPMDTVRRLRIAPNAPAALGPGASLDF